MRIGDYLARIGVTGPLAPTVATLQRVHLAHRLTFLFDNIDIQTGRGIRLDLESLEHKFIDQGRGGYCFEYNTLFLAALRELGFEAFPLLARVRRGPPARWMRTHMLIELLIDGAPWIADVGFGALGLNEPMPLRDGASVGDRSLSYSLRRERLWIVTMTDASGETDLYEFSEEPQTEGDVELANHYTATHPDSIFRRSLTLQRSGEKERLILRGATLARHADGLLTEQSIALSGLRATALEIFGVELPGSTLLCEESIVMMAEEKR